MHCVKGVQYSLIKNYEYFSRALTQTLDFSVFLAY